MIRLHNCKVKGLAPVVGDSKEDIEKMNVSRRNSQIYAEINNNRDHPTLSKPCYKVITCDKNDEIVDLQASLMVGVARTSCDK